MKRRTVSWCMGTLGLLIATGLVLGQSKSDFERASREKGCDMIPYYDLQRQCHDSYGDQTDWCTGERGRGCDNVSKNDKDEARQRMENAEVCLMYRKAVVGKFDSALDKLWRESDPDIKPFVDIITKRIVESQRGHRIAIDETERRREKCKELL
jgi:hypothetical protein